jgi:hypothetical protein
MRFFLEEFRCHEIVVWFWKKKCCFYEDNVYICFFTKMLVPRMIIMYFVYCIMYLHMKPLVTPHVWMVVVLYLIS